MWLYITKGPSKATFEHYDPVDIFTVKNMGGNKNTIHMQGSSLRSEVDLNRSKTCINIFHRFENTGL